MNDFCDVIFRMMSVDGFGNIVVCDEILFNDEI